MTRWHSRIAVRDSRFVSEHESEVFLLPAEGVRCAMAKVGVTDSRRVFVMVGDGSPWLRFTIADEDHLRVTRLDDDEFSSLLYHTFSNSEHRVRILRVGERNPWIKQVPAETTYEAFRDRHANAAGRVPLRALEGAPPSLWLAVAADQTIAPETLRELLEFTSWLPLWEAVAANPNADLPSLGGLAAVVPEIVLHNPALPLLMLMEPGEARLFPKGFLDQLDLHGAP